MLMKNYIKLLNKIVGILVISSLAACAHVGSDQQANQGANQEPNIDPWESWNRPVTSFNDGVDRVLLKPVAKGYRFVMPDVGEKAVDRFFDNLGEVSNLVNNLLQGQPGQAMNSTGRFLVNSTLGVGGFFEVANSMGMEKQDSEDFGQTLGVWGVKSGPYLVIPFLGPSTLRDTPSRVVDWQLDPVNYVEDEATQYSLNGVDLIQTRATLLDSEALISGDRYLFIRDAYLQRREYLVKDGATDDDDVDDFLDDF